MDFIIDADLDIRIPEAKCKLQNIVNKTEAFYSKNFASLHSVLTVDRANPEIYTLNNPKYASEISEYAFEVKEQSPFRIPIILRKEDSIRASIRKHEIVSSEDFGKFSPFAITNVNLTKPLTLLTYVYYAHEIMHCQVVPSKELLEIIIITRY